MIKDLQHQVFDGKPPSAVCSFAFAVSRCRDFKFLQGVHCLMPPCCFLSSQSTSLLQPQKTGIINLFKFKNQTSTSQTDRESYFVPLFVRLYNFQWKNPCRKSLTARCPSCRSTVNCKLQTRPQTLPSPCTGVFPVPLGQLISVTYPRRTFSLGPRDPKRFGRSE